MKRPPAAILPILLGLLAGSPLACREPGSQTPGETPPPPASTGAATSSGSSSDDTAAAPLACGCPSEAQDRDECPCPDDHACAADHALGDPAPEAFTCRPGCIPENDPLLWCFHVPNAADPTLGCCTGVCRPDGLCGNPIGPDPDTGTSTDPTTDDPSTSTGPTTDDTSTSTDPGTSTSTDPGTSTTAG